MGQLDAKLLNKIIYTDDRQTKRNISTPSHPNSHQSLRINGGRQIKWNNSPPDFFKHFHTFYAWYDVWLIVFLYHLFLSCLCVRKIRGLECSTDDGLTKRNISTPLFVAMGADRPNWIIRRQAFEENSFFTEDRQTDRNISTPSHPKRAIDRRLSLMSRVGTLAQMLWVKLFNMVSATSHLNWGVEVFLLVCRSSVENFAIIGAVFSFQGQQNG
jgi:hypothetical protein